MITAGKWKIKEGAGASDSVIFARTASGCPRYIARIYGEGILSRHKAERDSNATLISAAPDLLEAIQKLADYTEEKCREQCAKYAIDYFPPDDLLEAHAAINKALGI